MNVDIKNFIDRTMTQNEIDIIKREIAARLPYGVMVNVTNSTVYKDPMTVMGIDYSKELVKIGENIGGMFFTHTERVADMKPYLRPMESMTDDEYEYYWGDNNFINLCDRFDWLNRRMFDYRDLIVQGLALTAPEDMYDFSNTDESCNK